MSEKKKPGLTDRPWYGHWDLLNLYGHWWVKSVYWQFFFKKKFFKSAPSQNEVCNHFILGGDKVSRGKEILVCTQWASGNRWNIKWKFSSLGTIVHLCDVLGFWYKFEIWLLGHIVFQHTSVKKLCMGDWSPQNCKEEFWAPDNNTSVDPKTFSFASFAFLLHFREASPIL